MALQVFSLSFWNGTSRNEDVTYDDIFAVVDAGAESGILQEKNNL